MSKEQIGRIILEATSSDRNVRLTHEDGDILARECLRLADKARAFDQLRACMGYVENSSEQTVVIFQDDATRDFIMTCGEREKPRIYWAKSLQEVIATAHIKEKQE